MGKKVKVRFCGASTAQVPAIVISLLDILFSSVIIALLSYLTHMYVTQPEELERVVVRIDPQRNGNLANFLQYSSGEQVLMLTIPLISNILALLLGILLFISAIRKHTNSLRVWFVLTMVFMLIQIVIFATQVSAGRNGAQFIIPACIEFSYRIYSLIVVKCLINEIGAVEADGGSDDTVVVEAEPEA